MPEAFTAEDFLPSAGSSPFTEADFGGVPPSAPVFTEEDFTPAEAAPLQGFKRTAAESVGNLLKGHAAIREGLVSGDVRRLMMQAAMNEENPTVAKPEVQAALSKLESPQAMRPRMVERPSFKTGQEMVELAPDAFPLTPAQQKSKWTKAGEMAGGFLPALTGPAAPVVMGTQSIGEHITSDYDKILQAAKANGISDETARDMASKGAVDKAFTSGAIQAGIFALMPPVLRSTLEKYLVGRFGQAWFSRWLTGRLAAATEGAAIGGSSTAAENVIEGEPLGKDVVSGGGSLALVNLLLPWLRGKGEAAKPAVGEPGPGPGKTPEPNTIQTDSSPPGNVPIEQDLLDEINASLVKNQVAARPEQRPGETVEVQPAPASPQAAQENRIEQEVQRLLAESKKSDEQAPAEKSADVPEYPEITREQHWQRDPRFEELRLEGVNHGDAADLLEGKKTVKEVVEGNFYRVRPAWDATHAQEMGDARGHYEAWQEGYDQAISRLNKIMGEPAEEKTGLEGKPNPQQAGLETNLTPSAGGPASDERATAQSVQSEPASGESVEGPVAGVEAKTEGETPAEAGSPSAEKRKGVGLRARKIFERESEMNGPDILDWIKDNSPMMSKRTAKRTWSAERFRRNQSLWDDAPTLQRPHHNVIYGENGSTPDVVAQAAYDARQISEPSVNVLWEEVGKASKARSHAYEQQRRHEKILSEELAQHEAWRKAKTTGDIRVDAEELQPGDTLHVAGEELKVTERDPESGDITIEDGTKFGRQRVASGDSVYVERLGEELGDRLAAGEGTLPPEQRGATGGNLSTFGVFDPANYRPAIQLGRELVGKVRDFAEWSAEMIKYFGEDVKSHLGGIWQAIHSHDKAAEYQRMLAEHPNAQTIEFSPSRQAHMDDGIVAWNQKRTRFWRLLAPAHEVRESFHGTQFLTSQLRSGFREKWLADEIRPSPEEFNAILARWRAQKATWMHDRGLLPDEQLLGEPSKRETEGPPLAERPASSDLNRAGSESPREPSSLNEPLKAADQTSIQPDGEGDKAVPRTGSPTGNTAAEASGLPGIASGKSEASPPAEVKPKTVLDKAEQWLDDQIKKTDPNSGQMLEGVTGAPVWLTKSLVNGALRVVRSALRRGRELGEAITQGVEWLRHQNLNGYDENQARQFLHESFVRSLGEPSRNVVARMIEELPERGRMIFQWAEKQGRAAAARWRAMSNRDFIATLKDTADNTAKIFGKQTSNLVLHELNRAFNARTLSEINARDSLKEEALTFAVEAGGGLADQLPGIGPAVLRGMRTTIVESEHRGTIWARRALRAINFAEEHWETLKPVAQLYRQLTDAENAAENAAGYSTLYRRGGYVFHLQDVLEHWAFPDAGGGRGAGVAAPFRHIRDFSTYADSVAAGVSPKSLSAVDLLQKRMTLGRRLIKYGAWTEALRGVIDPTTELPVVTEPGIRTRADGSQDVTAPVGYKLQEFAGKQIAVHAGYAGLFTDLTEGSWLRGGPLRNTLMEIAGTSKHALLMFDTFHLARIGLWNAVSRTGLPTYARGLTLLDNSVTDLHRMIERGEIPAEWGNDLMTTKRKLDTLLGQGLNVGAVGDNLYSHWIQHLPLAGQFNKWLFENYQRGAMSEVALIEFERQTKMHPELSESQVARMVARDVNTRFGNLQSQSWIKSKTGQDLARLVFLAPQWNESLIRAEIGAVWQAGATLKAAARGRFQMGLLARSVGTAALGTFIANQLINYATRGKPTWENPEEDAGAKLSAWIPDAGGGPGFFLHPLAVPAEITHQIWRTSDRTGGDVSEAARRFLAGRLNMFGKPAMIFMTRKDMLGRSLRSGSEVAGEMGKSMAPVPIAAGAAARFGKQLVTGEHEEAFPGQYEKQLMQTFGIKTDQAPNPEQRIRGLAKDFMRAQPNYKPNPDFFGGDYEELRRALRMGNMRDAAAALEELRTKKTEAAIQKYMREWAMGAQLASGETVIKHPFTANAAAEREFRKTLTPEQIATYHQAWLDRQKVKERFDELVKKKPAAVAAEH